VGNAVIVDIVLGNATRWKFGDGLVWNGQNSGHVASARNNSTRYSVGWSEKVVLLCFSATAEVSNHRAERSLSRRIMNNLLSKGCVACVMRCAGEEHVCMKICISSPLAGNRSQGFRPVEKIVDDYAHQAGVPLVIRHVRALDSTPLSRLHVVS
jgi:hypothetical protein